MVTKSDDVFNCFTIDIDVNESHLASFESKARFKRRITAVPNSIDRIKFDFSTAVTRRLKPNRATAV